MKKLALASLLALTTISAANAATYSELLDLSARAIIAEKWRSGLTHTRDLLALPDLTAQQRAVGLTHLCIHLTQMGRTAHALQACNESIALNPTDWGSYVNRGNALSALGRTVAAKADYRKAQELNPAAEAVEIAESLQMATPYVFGRPPSDAPVQTAGGEQILAEP